MPLNLADLMKKAKEKNIVSENKPASQTPFVRQWQQESVLFHENITKENLGQTEDKVRTNIGQTKDKDGTKLGQIDDKLRTDVGQTRDKVKTQPRTELRTRNLGQTEDKVRTRVLTKLIGLQKTIILFIYDECQSVLDSETSPLSIEYVSNACKSTVLSVRKTIQRLIEKKVLIRVEYKDGRGGWTIYKLPEEIYQEINSLKSTNKLRTNLGQTEDKLETQLRTEPRTNDSRRRDIYNTSSSTDDSWNFDISAYEKFGFNEARRKQLITIAKLTAEEVEQSLIEFEYDFTHGTLPRIETTEINYLMGGLVKGSPYSSKAYKEAQNKAANERKERLEQIQHQKQLVAIVDWFEALDEEGIKQLEDSLPRHLKIRYKLDGILDKEVFPWVKEYYKNQQ